MFDWNDTRFAETAEPDPLSFGSPQKLVHAQQPHQDTHRQAAALDSSFQVGSYFGTMAPHAQGCERKSSDSP